MFLSVNHQPSPDSLAFDDPGNNEFMRGFSLFNDITTDYAIIAATCLTGFLMPGLNQSFRVCEREIIRMDGHFILFLLTCGNHSD